MKRINILFLTLLSSIYSLGAMTNGKTVISTDNTQRTNTRIFWDTETRRTVFQPGGYARITLLHDGRLMAVSEGNGINISFSEDRGNTWSKAQKIVNNAENIPNCVPDLIQLADSTLIVAYNPRPSKPYSPDRKFGIRCKRSTDGGQTWSEEIYIHDAGHTFENGCWEPSMLELPNGELQLYLADEGSYTQSNEQQISLCRSMDGGLTWSRSEKISFRKGFRDGMPVPVLLKDSTTIVVAIEDNGWAGYNNFYPTTVRNTVKDNWKKGAVLSDSPLRHQTVKLPTRPVANCGAPYLRVLPWGETILSYQDNRSGTFTMRTAVGNEDARSFGALSTPFHTDGKTPVLWNSLAVLDDGEVIAVGCVGRNVEIIKGHAMQQWAADFGRDAQQRLQKSESTSSLITMGAERGLRHTAIFTYDRDSLYFRMQVDDRTPNVANAQGDEIRLHLDVAGTEANTPQTSTWKLQLGRNGKLKISQGGNGKWNSAPKEIGIHHQIISTATHYTVQTSIPWSAFGLQNPPVGKTFAANIELLDIHANGKFVEQIPDAVPTAPCTWMKLVLHAL